MPKVFVSATSRDLRSYRQVVADWAKSRDLDVVIQDDFEVQPDYVTVVKLLRDKIAPCDIVIHLAGLFYGFEPANLPPAETRRSYTQLEYELGKEYNRPVYRFIARDNYTPDNPYTQTPEQAELQLKHRNRLTQGCEPYSPTARTSGNELYYEFSTHEELRKLLELIPPIAPTVNKPRNLPLRSIGSLFKGRDAFLEQLRQALTSKPTHIAAVTGKHAIHGLGGIGKTRVAVEYGHRHEHEYTALLFITADSPSSLEQNLAQLCSAMVLNLPEQNAREQAVQVAAAIRWLREHAGWFLIVDNVDTDEARAATEKLLLDLSTGHIVITSRLADWQSGVEALALDVLSEDAATDFLLDRTRDKRRSTPTDAPDARALAKDLDGLALALEQAGAYIVKHRLRIADYRDRWREQEAKVLEWFDEYMMKYPKSVAITWQTSIDRMSDDGKRLLNVLCWLSPDPIPRDLIEKLTTQEGEPGIDVEKGLSELAAYSLARWSEDASAVTIHKLVEEMTRYRLPAEERRGWLKRALRMVDDFVDGDPEDVRTWAAVYTPARSHIISVTSQGDQEQIAEPMARLMNQLGLYLDTRAEFAEAESLYRRGLTIEESSLRPDHNHVATYLNNLAHLLDATNRLEEAEPLLRRALAIDESSLGPHHPNVAIRLNNLSQLLKATNRLEEAEPLMKRALAIDEPSFGPHHPTVAIRLNNLAQLLQATNRLEEAEPLMKRALAIDESSFGPHHPKVAIRLNNLAQLLKATNRLEEAEPLMKRALAIDESSFGPNHPRVAICLNNLAQLLQATNRLEEAEPLMKRALAIDESSFGPHHPKVAIRLNNLARLLHDTNRLEEAEPLMKRALAIDESSFGPQHPRVAIELNNLARLLQDTNRLEEAEPLMKRALAIDESSFGPQHPNVAISLNSLALLFRATNRLEEAEPLMKRALGIFCRSLGEEHPNSRTVKLNYELLLRDMKLPEEDIQQRIQNAIA